MPIDLTLLEFLRERPQQRYATGFPTSNDAARSHASFVTVGSPLRLSGARKTTTPGPHDVLMRSSTSRFFKVRPELYIYTYNSVSHQQHPFPLIFARCPYSKMSFPETISVIAIDKTGGIEVLEKKTVPFPTQKPGEIVVKVS